MKPGRYRGNGWRMRPIVVLVSDLFHGKMLVPPGGTNSSVGGTNSNTNGIKRKYPPHLSLMPTSLIICTTFTNHWYQMYIYY